nr:MAG TPA: hypothetical protein [Caudoviricetes sp.]DAP92383.1 MAG TPA: hypothetical protein [Caudoviricetes sp.]DAQ17461.1 MAG TPA: hypothetical protein [Caudoviricetes sp.]DAT45906.1 MAG TPA: hypothetical protein [Caudoviricetes sp.]
MAKKNKQNLVLVHCTECKYSSDHHNLICYCSKRKQKLCSCPNIGRVCEHYKPKNEY